MNDLLAADLCARVRRAKRRRLKTLLLSPSEQSMIGMNTVPFPKYKNIGLRRIERWVANLVAAALM